MPSLVLDLDETLLHTTRASMLTGEQKAELEITDWNDDDETATIHRPGLREFSAFVNANFDDVYVYTAGQLDYAKEIVEKVLGDFCNLHSVWSRGHCEWTFADPSFKPLWNKIRGPCTRCIGPCYSNCPKVGESLDAMTTFMIDDRDDITKYNVYVHGPQQIVIPPFRGEVTDKHLTDTVIPVLKQWLTTHKN
jgi:hypothetical protein